MITNNDNSEMKKVGIPEYKNRAVKLWNSLQSDGVDLAVVNAGPNFQYLAGYSFQSMERLAVLIVQDGEITALVPGLMEDQVRENTWIKNIISWKDTENPYDKFREIVDIKGIKKIGLDGNISYSHYSRMFHQGEYADITMINSHISKLREVKSERENHLIGQSIKLSEKALEETLNEIKAGVKEKEIARKLEWNFIEEGLTGPAFSSIVAFGENCAKPHHEPGERRLKQGDSIIIDFGGSFGGYSSDTTRTFAYGEPGEEFRKAYESVKEAQHLAMGSVSDGARYNDLDMSARKLLRKMGYGETEIRLGHGLGIEVHEPPFLTKDNSDTIREGTVFTVEPGIYRYGKYGIRIEDTTYVKNSKCVSFNSLRKDFSLQKL